MPKPELLAPAGDWKSFVAAVEAGADAVYFGGKDFSARSFAAKTTNSKYKLMVFIYYSRHFSVFRLAQKLLRKYTPFLLTVG